MKRFLVSLVAWTWVAGCGPAEEFFVEQKVERPPDQITFAPIITPGYTCPPGNVVSWENFAEGFITRQCVSCHSVDLAEGERADAPIGVDFNTYEMVRLWANRMFARAAYDCPHSGGCEVGAMPPAGGPYPEDRILFGDWLACQAPRERDMHQE